MIKIKMFNKFNLQKKLGILLLALGFFAIFAGSPYEGAHATINAKELSLIVEKESDHVKPMELAEKIIEGTMNYRLIDLRDEEEFNKYHIPYSENLSITDLNTDNVLRNEKILLTAEDGEHATQAWFLLKAKEYKTVYILDGGIENWKDKILFPKLSDTATPEEKEEYAKIKEVCKFFGGIPQTGGSDDNSPEIKMPQMEMPANLPPPPKGKKRKEGC